MLFSRYIPARRIPRNPIIFDKVFTVHLCQRGYSQNGRGMRRLQIVDSKTAKRIAAAFPSWQNQSEKGDGSEDSYEKTASRLLTNAAPPLLTQCNSVCEATSLRRNLAKRIDTPSQFNTGHFFFKPVRKMNCAPPTDRRPSDRIGGDCGGQRHTGPV
eukprot:COSAG02_NODE_479_length_21477_cov_49.737674_6_plen_157_part_00